MMRALALLSALALIPLPATAQPFTAEQRAAIVEILREALVSDPSILREAFAALEAAEREAEAEARRAAVRAQAEALFRNAEDPVLGPARARVTVVEFTDYRCPYCRSMRGVILDLLRQERDVRVVVKPMPILGPASVTAARAAMAAHLQGKFAPFHDALLALRGEIDEAAVLQVAAEVGLDAGRLRRDMNGAEVTRRISAALNLAQALGLQGTPAYVVGETVFPGAVPLARLRQAVAEARGQAR
ncbi:DsbA family protein [Elioraea thermophila]|uniref:DsbA family protein n=1 Tax=Elioraea thermophila TaxID=2185104 RepID=UPI000DF34300|nr:DsbA family protein [Elioraea thermophila]